MAEENGRITPKNPLTRFTFFCMDLIEKPVIWFRETVVVPNRKEYYWYHEKIKRVPTIDQCYEDDAVCRYEAEEQFQRDKKVDRNIVAILKKRFDHCLIDNPLHREACDSIFETYNKAATNFFIKYGDLGLKLNAFRCLMKQKNRMAWERRHGPVGTGRKIKENV